ncbi:DUF3289 family protein [Cronobacter dublinensis]
MTRLTSFPINLFTSQRKFNDHNADDMKCGDLTEYQLKNSYFIYDVSNIVDPFTLSKKTGFNNPQSMFAGVMETIIKILLTKNNVQTYCLMS